MAERIFLIGYRCTGKSSVARLLAGRLGWQWVDADLALETRFGRSIPDIFADEGEAGFRDKESEVLAELCGRENLVVATGGGVILRPENRLRLRQSGKVVLLTAPPETLWQRMQQDESAGRTRPLLAEGGLAEIEEMLRIRRPLYAECADLTVDTTRCSPAEAADIIVRACRPAS